MNEMPRKTITVAEARERFGDLTYIENNATKWIEIPEPGGVWKPIFNQACFLIAYGWFTDGV